MTSVEEKSARPFQARSNAPFFICLSILGGVYVLLIAMMLLADVFFDARDTFRRAADTGSFESSIWVALKNEKIRYSLWLSMISCSITAILSLWVAVPVGYLMSRVEFRGKALVDAVLDIPIVLPPLVVGVSLLILFKVQPFDWLRDNVVFEVPAVILAQFMVACAFAVRTMRATFDQISTRREDVALTLGASRGQAFFAVVLPEAKRGMLTAGTLAWARSLGEFGPILVFAGSTRMHTEVLPTTVFLELQAGNLAGAIAVSLIMVIAAVAVLVTARVLGVRQWGM